MKNIAKLFAFVLAGQFFIGCASLEHHEGVEHEHHDDEEARFEKVAKQVLPKLEELLRIQTANLKHLEELADADRLPAVGLREATEKVLDVQLRIAEYTGDPADAIKSVQQLVRFTRESIKVAPELIQAGRMIEGRDVELRTQLLELEILLIELKAEQE